jgi:hypothetical protein
MEYLHLGCQGLGLCGVGGGEWDVFGQLIECRVASASAQLPVLASRLM